VKVAPRFSLILLAVTIPCSVCRPQSPSHPAAPGPRNESTISVQELATPAKAERIFEKATTLLVKGDAPGSVPFFRQAIEQAPNSYRFHHNLGLALFRTGQFDESGEEFQKSIDLTNGSYAPSLFGFSMIFYRKGDYSHAQALIENGLLQDPGSATGKYCLALVQYSLGKIAEAERNAHDALLRNAKLADVYVLLARIHERLNNPNAVIADIQTYLKFDPHGTLQQDAVQLLQRAQADLSHLSASLN